VVGGGFDMKMLRYFLTFASVLGVFAPAIGSFPAAAQQNEILQQVIQRGTVRIAVMGANQPWSSLASNGEPQGYEIDLAKQLAAALGVKPEFVITDNPGRVVMLQSHKADIAIAEYTATIERAKAIAFTRPYMTIGAQFMVLAERDDLKTLQDLDKSGTKVGASRGGYTQTLVPALLPKVTISNFDNIDDEVLALNAKQVDATTENWMWNKDLIKKNAGKYRVIPDVFSREEISIGLPKGDFEWWRVLDMWVEQFNSSGDNNRLFKQWFGYDIPSSN
jgi:polar amino acid transport system substrate-binding protein